MAGWLQRLFGGGGREVGVSTPRPAAPSAPSPAAPPARGEPVREPLVLPEGGDNPVHALLDAAGVPWRTAREELTARYGVTVDPFYDWEVLALPAEGPLADGALLPLSAQVGEHSSRMPPTYLSTVIWHVDDARENVRLTAAALRPWLGEAPIAEQYNTVRCEWRFGAASVALTAWPPDLQDEGGGEIEAYEREPRLAVACHLAIETGFRPGLTERERAWLDSFVTIARLSTGDDRAVDIADNPAPETELEFVREPPADIERFFGQVGRSADGAALIFCERQLYVVPVEDIVGFEVIRTLPAKGGGGSHLMAEARLTAETTTTLSVATSHGPDALTGVGEALAAATGRPLAIAPYDYDV